MPPKPATNAVTPEVHRGTVWFSATKWIDYLGTGEKVIVHILGRIARVDGLRARDRLFAVDRKREARTPELTEPLSSDGQGEAADRAGAVASRTAPLYSTSACRDAEACFGECGPRVVARLVLIGDGWNVQGHATGQYRWCPSRAPERTVVGIVEPRLEAIVLLAAIGRIRDEQEHS